MVIIKIVVTSVSDIGVAIHADGRHNKPTKKEMEVGNEIADAIQPIFAKYCPNHISMRRDIKGE